MDTPVIRLLPTPATGPVRKPPEFEPDVEKIEQRLLMHGVYPTPKILRNLRKKEIQKHNRRIKRKVECRTTSSPPVTEAEKQSLEEESRYQTLRREYKQFSRSVAGESGGGGLLVGKPWEGIDRVRLKELAGGGRREEVGGGKLRRENLGELKKMLEQDLRWALEDDVDLEELHLSKNNGWQFDPAKRWRNDGEAIRVLVDRLSSREITEKHWKFVRMMKQSGLQFTEDQLLKIVDKLGHKRSWKQALAVVHWVYSDKQRKLLKSRFVYTKLLSVLGIARRPQEAHCIFNQMLGDCQIYPDIAAYHSIAVTLGQAGLLKDLLKVIERMRQKPVKQVKNLRQKNWEPELEPDLVVYNAVLNACGRLRQWKGVSWVFTQLRKSGIRPNGATYGLAMEVMLESGKYELVHEFFRKMERSGEAPKAITYRVIVQALRREGKIEEAVEAVRDMEQRGVIGTGSVYYELACCLCSNGRWRDAMLEVEKMKRLRDCKPLEVTFTGLIAASMDGGYIDDCVSLFENMKDYCRPNIGTMNMMLRVYGKNDMFSEARELFEEITRGKGMRLVPDEYTYSLMLEASARALQWEYAEYVYQDMILFGYQLDQTKYASLLTEASRAGKWCLLEHAFDALLEAGEIPHPMLFTQMLCHATAQGNYQRAIALINTVALAPFHITEKQWMNIFEENQDWIKPENLKKLLDCLRDCDLAAEPTVTNLLKSVKSLCGTYSSTDALSSVDDTSSRRSQAINRSNTLSSTFIMNDTERPHGDLQLTTTGMDNDDNERRLPDAFADLPGKPWDFTEAELQALGFEEFVTQTEDEDDADESFETDSPSAYEILKEWEDSRKKDGMFGNSF